MTENFFKRIKKIRIALKYSQLEFSVLLDVSLSTYRKWERGVLFPDCNDLDNIANKLHINVDFIMGRSDSIKIELKDLKENYTITHKKKGNGG